MKEVDTFFGAYVNLWTNYDHDSLLQFLDSINELEEVLQEERDMSLQVFTEYVVLDAVRNYWHRHGELNSHIILAKWSEMQEIHTDFPFLCLIDVASMANVIDAIDEEYREEDRQTIDETVHYYGNIINLGHILFNIASLTMHKLLHFGIEGTSKEFGIAREILRSDPAIGKPITFSGWFEGEPGLVCASIEKIYHKAM